MAVEDVKGVDGHVACGTNRLSQLLSRKRFGESECFNENEHDDLCGVAGFLLLCSCAVVP